MISDDPELLAMAKEIMALPKHERDVVIAYIKYLQKLREWERIENGK